MYISELTTVRDYFIWGRGPSRKPLSIGNSSGNCNRRRSVQIFLLFLEAVRPRRDIGTSERHHRYRRAMMGGVMTRTMMTTLTGLAI